ncbi:hypothetical protein [Rhodohalobacter barkolensis]|uniref:hypothetical protein n=1 Tax=Rhodohalobacter barkolensis TaxID=2053187 RepID=UPI0010561336|nr:hypothetical protein [Rhodohalobacter barkolensis]
MNLGIIHTKHVFHTYGILHFVSLTYHRLKPVAMMLGMATPLGVDRNQFRIITVVLSQSFLTLKNHP